jgi:hypothetical protein
MKATRNHNNNNNKQRGNKSRSGTSTPNFVLGAAPAAPKKHGDLKIINPAKVGNSVVFPNKLRKTFTTSGNTTLTGDGVGIAPVTYTVSANSLFDPDYTGTGHSPRYYDTLVGAASSNAPYGKYNVESARLRVEFVNSGSAAAALGDVGIFARPATVTTLDTSWEMYESENAVAMPLGSGYSDNGIRTLCVEIDKRLMAKLQNSKDILDDVDNMGVYNGDPGMEILFDMMFIPYLVSSTNLVYLRWTLEQDAVLWTLNETVDSSPAPPPRHPSIRCMSSLHTAPPATRGCAVPTTVANEAVNRRAVGHPLGCYCSVCRQPIDR